ncbi:MAG: hypothetical protein INR68_15715 [Methylobacterium mesophilicum]|nr:hypothetical protein [Methylobacterium mesophilicum]
MRKLLIAMVLAALPAEAFAIQRYQSTSLSCEQARAIIREEGAALLQWQSRRVRNLPRYERFVRNDSFCQSQEYAAPTVVPTADTEQCPVKRCEERLSIGDDFFRFRR